MKRAPAPSVTVLSVAGAIAFTLALAACGSGDEDGGAQGDARSPVVPGVTVVATAPPSGGDTPVAATPGAGDPGAGGGAPTAVLTPLPPRPTPSFPTKTEPAPIDDAELIVRESFPPQYAVRIVAGLPSGCHQFDAATVARNGTDITVTVTNIAPDDAGIACTAIYGQHEEIVELGADFISGAAYSVTVNDRKLEFTAE